MPFNQHHRHRSSSTTGEPLDNQLPTSPLDTGFSIPPIPVTSVFSQSSTCLSPRDVPFPGPAPTPVLGTTTTIKAMTTSNHTFTSTITRSPPSSTRRTMKPRSTTQPIHLSPPPPQLARPRKAFSAHRSSRLRHQRNPTLLKKLHEMALPLAPLVQLTTGQIHPSFPSTLLNFWLLTDAELESLAHFYHQRTPCRWTGHYPCPVAWDSSVGLEEKRRRIGKFIGLKGCETPVRVWSEEELLEEARRVRQREEEEEVWRKKLSWY